MAHKRKTSAGDASTAKRQKKVMSLSDRVVLLDRLSGGQSVASVGRLYGVNNSTIATYGRMRRQSEKVFQ